MEIIIIYVIIGVLISASIYIVADFCHLYYCAILCIAWLPLIIIGVVISPFMDIEEISNKLNK